MKIIKEGVDPRKIPIRGTCSNCGTEVEFTKDEAKYHPAPNQREVDSWTVTCPVCMHTIWGY